MKDTIILPLHKEITYNTFTITTYKGDESFKNGTYEFSASSIEDSFDSWKIQPYYPFNGSNSGLAWFSKGTSASAFNKKLSKGYTQSPYNRNGNYQGGGVSNTWRTNVNNKSYSGEWIQMKLPYKIHLTRYSMTTNAKQFVILGSNDGSIWTEIDNKTTTGVLTDEKNQFIITSSNKDAFSYYRIVFQQIYTSFRSISNILGLGVFSCSLYGDYNTEQFSTLQKEPFGTILSHSVFEGYDNNVYGSETKLLADLTRFNQLYLDCSNSNSQTCPTAKRNEYDALYTTITDSTTGDIQRVTNAATATTGLRPTEYAAAESTLIDTHNNVLKLRNELDVKMKELTKERNSKYGDYKSNFDSAIYTNILVTVLATTILYFAFIKL